MENKLDNTKQIEKDFNESWDLIESLYKEYPDDNHTFTDDALKLIKEMRKLSLDKQLRAGQSLWFLILTRNRRHGLDKEPHLRITFLGKNKMVVNSNFNGEESSQESEVQYNGYLEKMTIKLLEQNIIWNEYDNDVSDPFFNF